MRYLTSFWSNSHEPNFRRLGLFVHDNKHSCINFRKLIAKDMSIDNLRTTRITKEIKLQFPHVCK